MRFSVIIPVFNEEKLIGPCIDNIHVAEPEAEIIVADGGSSDQTADLALGRGAVVLNEEYCRGRQCNTGAKKAQGDILVFLHADTKLPKDAFSQLRSFFSDQDVLIGTFRFKLDIDHWILRWYAFCARFDSVLTRFGDQCIVARKEFFDQIGGFPEWSLFEDVRLLQEARKHTGIDNFPGLLVISSRRFVKNGIVKQYFYDAWLMLQYLLKVPVQRLEEKYGGVKS